MSLYNNNKTIIPATILPNYIPGNEHYFPPDIEFIPVIIPGMEGKYIILEDPNDPYGSVFFPRSGFTYDTKKGFKAHASSGNIRLYKYGKEHRVDAYDIQVENEMLLLRRDRAITEFVRKLQYERIKARYMNGM